MAMDGARQVGRGIECRAGAGAAALFTDMEGLDWRLEREGAVHVVEGLGGNWVWALLAKAQTRYVSSVALAGMAGLTLQDCTASAGWTVGVDGLWWVVGECVCGKWATLHVLSLSPSLFPQSCTHLTVPYSTYYQLLPGPQQCPHPL